MNKTEFIIAVSKSFCYRDLAKNLGFKIYGSIYKKLNRLISEYDADISHFCKNRKSIEKRRIDISDYLNNKRKIKPLELKNKLIKAKIKEHKCEICNLSLWNKEPIPIQLHHIDGNNQNNSLSNLHILCPNCHAQTNNYCGKNVKKKEKKNRYCVCGNLIVTRKAKTCVKCCYAKRRKVSRPSKEQLEIDILNLPFTKIGKKYSVSDNCIRQWCKSYNLI